MQMELDILGYQVKVKKVSALKDKNGVPVDAEYISEPPTIRIDSKLRGKRYVHALVHEIFHAVTDIVGAHNCQISHDLEEILADNMGRVMGDNFELRGRK